MSKSLLQPARRDKGGRVTGRGTARAAFCYRVPMLQKTNLAGSFERITEHWKPKIAGMVNDTAIKLVKLRGEFVWHRHDHEDELFLVVHGRLTMKLRDGEVTLDAGELLIVPRGVEHVPVAAEETWVMLVEPASTLNTGNVTNDRTVVDLEHI
jgi:mannose-6-phosphate isomerase-like protein (cupin superfamily)